MIIPSWQKLIAILPYLLPWSDAIPFGKFLFIEFPTLRWLALPTLPIVIIENSVSSLPWRDKENTSNKLDRRKCLIFITINNYY